jgi:hypothetical protein
LVTFQHEEEEQQNTINGTPKELKIIQPRNDPKSKRSSISSQTKGNQDQIEELK